MREYELEVLEQYDIEVQGTRKIRGAFFCDTKEGTMLLKEAQVSARRAPLLYALLQEVSEEGCLRADIPVKNKEGGFVSTSRDGTRYMLKKWFPGRECDVKKVPEILLAAENLACLHGKMKWRDGMFEESEGVESCPPIGRNLCEEWKRHNREMKKIRVYTRNKVSKNIFEFLFLERFEEMYSLAERMTRRLEASQYADLYADSIREGCLVHGDYNYHNVILLPATGISDKTCAKEGASCGGVATTNFEHFRLDVQMQDLYYFLRKVLEKHRWEERLGLAILEAYQSVRPLTEREWEYLALNLAYPEKFWKTVNTYYHSNKAWAPEKNVEKLKTAVSQTEEKLRFLERIFSFHL